MIYLDYSATTPVDKRVLNTFNKVCLEYPGNSNSLHKLGSEAMELENYATDRIKDILQLFSETEVVVGTRFHSIILGWLNKKKVLPIVYDEKTKNVLNDLEYKNYINLEEMDSCDIKNKLEGIERLNDKDVDMLKEKAKTQFWALDNLLRK